MDPELNTSEADFKLKLDQWISQQGAVFEIKNTKGIRSLLPKLCLLALKLSIVGFIVLAGCWFYLSNRSSSDSYREMVQGNLQSHFDSPEVEVKSILRLDKGIINGEMNISNIVIKESSQTFFSDWYVLEPEEDKSGRQIEIENKKYFTAAGISLSPFGIADGVFSGWKGKKIEVSILDCKLKVGADTDGEALNSYLQLFKKPVDLDVNVVIIREANIQWGYGVNQGSIVGSSITAEYINDSWELDIKGGLFSHGWLKGAEIDKMTVICHKDGRVDIKSAKLLIGGGSMELSATISVKSKFKVKGEYSFKGVDVLTLIGYEEWFSGKIKGKGSISGEMNTQDGLKIETEVTLNNAGSLTKFLKSQKDLTAEQFADSKENSHICLKNRFSIFEDVLKFIDTTHIYSLLEFDVGSFKVTQQGNNTSFNISGIGVRDFLMVDGDFTFNSVKASEVEMFESEIDEENELDGGSTPVEANGLKFEDEEELVNRFSGKLRLGFLPQVFERYPEILAVYPMDKETGRVWIPVKMEGGLDDISSEIAEKIDKIIQEEEDCGK